MTALTFTYSIDSEVQRVKSTLRDSEWLRERGYRFSLPTFSSDAANVSDADIREAVAQEYDERDFDAVRDLLLAQWQERRGAQIERIQQRLVGAKTLNTVNIVLTKYGTAGSYRAPESAIILNLQANKPEFLIKTVTHECIHLMIEHLIQEHHVSHWHKERMVDLIMDKEFESTYKMQDLPDVAKGVDSVFTHYYPDAAQITEKIGGE